MNEYTCQHCGATLHLLQFPERHRTCPHCHRLLRACANCEFYDRSGCILGCADCFTAAHGNRCEQFRFRVPITQPTP